METQLGLAELAQTLRLLTSGDPSYPAAVPLALAGVLAVVAAIAILNARKFRAREREVAQLKSSLERRTRQLEGAYEQLGQADMARSERMMLKGSHELRAPVATIETLLAVVLEGFSGELPPKCREILERASARVSDLHRLVDDLLVLSLARELKAHIDPRTVDVREEIHSVVDGFRDEAARKGIELSCSLPEEIPRLQGDPEGLARLLSNLLSNAIRYTQPGGAVVISVGASAASLHIVVSDTGIGIERSDQDRIFEEFYRAERARRMVKNGSGLGLAIVKTIIDAHKGSISVDSEPDQGTTFSVSLPLGQAEEGTREGQIAVPTLEMSPSRNYGGVGEQAVET